MQPIPDGVSNSSPSLPSPEHLGPSLLSSCCLTVVGAEESSLSKSMLAAGQMDDGQSPEPSSHGRVILPVTPGQQGWQEGLRQPTASTYLHHTTQEESPVPGDSVPRTCHRDCLVHHCGNQGPISQGRLTLVSEGVGREGQLGRAEVAQPPRGSRQGTTSRRAGVTQRAGPHTANAGSETEHRCFSSEH